LSYAIRNLKIEGSFVVKFQRHTDTRGWFSRVYDSLVFAELDQEEPKWVQQNESLTLRKGSARGMHFQHEPFSEAKYVRCTAGSVMDILLDTRVDSPTYGLADAVELDHRESMAVFIPSGCAHGFQSLQGDSRIHYLVSEKFTPTAESGFSVWSKEVFPLLPLTIADVSDRDRTLPLFYKETHDSVH
jgi:dTDP-4-dehydrorhamnose 3,5-epimerase